MIVDLGQIRALLSGEIDELHVTASSAAPKVGTEHPIQPAVGKRAKCRVLVVETWPHKHGGHVVKVELAPWQQPPRLLAPSRSGNYTSDLHRGMRDAGEAVPRAYQDRVTSDAHFLDEQEAARRRLAWQQRDFIERLEDEIIEAERLGLPTHRDMARLEQGLAKLARRNALARQQRNGNGTQEAA